MKALAWPEGLGAEMALPFALWRTLDLIDGQRDAAEVARLAGLSAPELRRQLREAERWVERAQDHQRPVTAEATQTVTGCLLQVVGPVAELMIDETLEDLGGGATLSALLAGLAAELTPEQMARFAQHLRARGLA
ncbi:hypothetical protein QR90_11440 [Deinococcus radiopugnans]|uniref:DUF8082 domain-containing protein n=2 Tax=Deinococcus radiopugnans TaxID=57497 RepID=A0A0A7KHD7_9DEIO|nr:hypothetical protein [Deinococcus radiopugnans]AIZ45561.1 hypothetical protein QR90_11440 [Deinococcus radiopugnans]MBB6016137.1 hypothetical protein [Deinococcus radiopugnans ATCC 19172]QLG11287.1 hypothetical protein HLB42_11210 [Deinococcus sp. D7000]TNM72160.1 hypothetical protein FHR04_04840 [Deinococcus radiopugnans ATCC 19172]